MSNLRKSRREKSWHSLDALQRYARLLGYGEIYHKNDNNTGLNAFIALHSTKRGPAIGGCRLAVYTSANFALKDALRLGYMMTLKAAVTDLPHGGAKSVIMMPDKIRDRHAFFQSFGQFVNDVGGRYVTAIDVGSTTADMDAIATKTSYVIGAEKTTAGHGDPSPYTALGIVRGMEASIQHKLGRDDFDGLHIAFQGAGRVAYYIMKNLHERGARFTVCDVNKDNAQRCVDEFDAKVVDINSIFNTPCDIFSPCALGGSLNLDTINQLDCKIIAGAANNQLAHKKYIHTIMQKDILYAPEFVANAGGLINASSMYLYQDPAIGNMKIDKLTSILLKIFERSERMKYPTTDIAEAIAKENLIASGDTEDQGLAEPSTP